MKKLLILLPMAIFMAVSCSNETAKTETDNTQVAEKQFYCPMKCEGEKVYATEGKCPTCGMALVEVQE